MKKPKWTFENICIQFSSVAQSCPTLCNPMDCSMPVLFVHHQLLEFTQTHVHWSRDAIQPSILCCPLLLLPSIFPSIRVFSNELVFCIRCPKYWSFSLSISPSNKYSGLISFMIDLILQFKGLSRVFSSTTVWKHQFFGIQPSLWSNSHTRSWLLGKRLLKMDRSEPVGM